MTLWRFSRLFTSPQFGRDLRSCPATEWLHSRLVGQPMEEDTDDVGVNTIDRNQGEYR